MSSSQDRQLPATQRKLDQARRDGQAARSKDLSHLAVLGTGSVALLLLAPSAFEQFRSTLAQALVFNAGTVSDPAEMLHRLAKLVGLGLIGCIAFAAIVTAATVISTVAAGGWVASTKAIMPDLKRLNPLSGIGNLLSKQQFTNVAKLVFMSALLGAVAWNFVAGSIDTVVRMVLQPSPSALVTLGDWLVSGMSLMLLVIVAAAVIDVPLQGFFHRAKLRMSHQEVKQEHKESDGNPLMKGKQRSNAREIAQRASITAVPRADFVLMNPTHYAVAMRYDETSMNAPQVISKGADLLAMKIREIANEHGIPVVQSPMLARALFAHAEIDQPIPSSLYTAVAQVLAYVYRLKSALRGEGAMPQTVPEPFVPPELDPHNVKPAAAEPIVESTAEKTK
ncbi:MAG: EscU/YscU/HrcU family type III secretion system export apparatus switch protein [Gammaproteobacteria bacterium]|nr:EscU/YscU/HrcU family type III secretion system export apparatus switch protein [Gammaproteobacteria bacterium]MBU1442643.1 EscU/YscU/HrcU family type III secretion system export apparatus switch protein [Gammaproteobacteria bacterium]MBU2285421.1 EscU/YscU/HrcU family type III secretion system export apparatus switch protein [Gammaproteobacteria bacterium]